MRYAFYSPIILIASALVSSCGSPSVSNNNISNARSTDSAAILKLVKDVYSWHDAHVNEIDFNVIVHDTLQIGIDSTDLMKHIDQLTKTRFFTDHFIATYRKIGYAADSVLRSSPHYNEINFNFQDADPWTFFQDEAPRFWDHLIITNFKLNGDKASLTWNIEEASHTYIIRFAKIKGDWKVDYMEGFDENGY